MTWKLNEILIDVVAPDVDGTKVIFQGIPLHR